METHAHARLKELGLAWLVAQGAKAVASEVTTPIPRWRVDCAGWFDRERGSNGARQDEAVVAIECKQSRADFLREDDDAQFLLAERDRLERRRQHLETVRIPRYEPHLRQPGTSLFADMEEWDYAASRMGAYRKVLCELRRNAAAIHGSVKFCLMARWRLADRLYVLAPAGMIRPHELPHAWGLLEAPPRALARNSQVDAGCVPLRLSRAAEPLHGVVARRVRFLRNIAVAACRQRLDTLAAGPGSSVG